MLFSIIIFVFLFGNIHIFSSPIKDSMCYFGGTMSNYDTCRCWLYVDMKFGASDAENYCKTNYSWHATGVQDAFENADLIGQFFCDKSLNTSNQYNDF